MSQHGLLLANSHGVVIQDSAVINNGQDGILFRGGRDVKIENTTVHNNSRNGLALDISNNYYSDFYINNSTFTQNGVVGGAGYNFKSSGVSYSASSPININITNSIIATNPTTIIPATPTSVETVVYNQAKSCYLDHSKPDSLQVKIRNTWIVDPHGIMNNSVTDCGGNSPAHQNYHASNVYNLDSYYNLNTHLGSVISPTGQVTYIPLLGDTPAKALGDPLTCAPADVLGNPRLNRCDAGAAQGI
jgi:hypothetical protein